MDMVIHAPIDGVITGLPNHGLTAEWLGDLGFRRVFAGHYHNHKDFGNGVYSIGAIAHHTWSDPGSKAGFLSVTDEEVKWMKSHAPEFVDIDASMEPEEIALLADQNYVRAKIDKTKPAEVEELRKWLMSCGAKGVIINTVRTPTHSRSTSTVKAGASIETSINEFIEKSELVDAKYKTAVARKAVEILSMID